MEKEERRAKSAAYNAARHLFIVKARNKRITSIVISLCVCLVLVACIATAAYLLLRAPADDGTILDNVIVGGVNIGGMTPEDAENVIRLTVEPGITTQNMVIRLDNDTLTLTPQATGISLDVDALVEAAYSYGRTGSNAAQNLARAAAQSKEYHIALLPYLTLDLEYIYSTVEDFCAGYRTELTQPTVQIIGERPVYVPPVTEEPEQTPDGEPPAETTPIVHQTLVITMGTPKSDLRPSELYYAILDGYSLFNMQLTYAPPVLVEPETPNAQEIFDAHCAYPVDAAIDNKTFAITDEVYGYGFYVDVVQRQIDRAAYGETLEITLEFLMPDITAEALSKDLFQDVLATYTSTCGDAYNANRDKNLKQACASINGYVIKVGESFDFNQILGMLTKARGYASAPTYSGSTTSTMGGGVSQVSSALYYCALLSELQIDEHHCHRYAMAYTPLGTDSAVTYGSENLIFTNNTTAPIRIVAEANGSTVTITLYGTETHNYRTEIRYAVLETHAPITIYQSMSPDNVYGYKDGQVIQTGLTGSTVQVYLDKYSPRTGLLMSSTLIEENTYEKRDEKIIRIETGQDEIVE